MVVVVYAADETEQRLREVEEEHKRLKLIFNHLPMAALALFDAQTGNLIMGSKRYLASVALMHHLPQDELIGRNWQELTLIPSKEQAIDLWQTALQNQAKAHIAELPYEGPEGLKLTWDYTLTPLIDTEEPNQVRFMLVSAVDITNQVYVQKELETLGKLKDDFLALTSHELRNPLTAIQGSAQLLQKTIKKQKNSQQDHTEQKDWEIAILDTITRQTRRMSKLIKEMTDSAHIQAHMFELQKKTDVNIVELAQRVIEQYTQDEQNNNIVLQSEEETILGTWDEDRIEQVLINLITNALKYSPADKPIVVQIEHHSENPEDVVIISVQDYGPGISEEDQAHIFNRFYQADKTNHKKQEGLGLGLYISHEIVTYHGGHIRVRSSLGQGTTFYFMLPLQKPSDSTAKPLPEDSRIKAIEQ